MGDCMNYQDKPIDFIKGYSFKDKGKYYTNGVELAARKGGEDEK